MECEPMQSVFAGAQPVHKLAQAQQAVDPAKHVCNSSCTVSHYFGNVYRCERFGGIHVCDANCDQRVVRDRYNYICRLSRKLFPRPAEDVVADSFLRKRSSTAGSSGGMEAEPALKRSYNGC